MPDVMVTARMSEEKKQAGNRVLDQLGTNASQAVNRLYDYLVEKKELPFPEQGQRKQYTREELESAATWAESLKTKHRSRLADMTLKEVKRERLIARGLLDSGDVG